jgi:hypothetical protein
MNQADLRQQGKIKYHLNEIIGIAFFAMAANADDFVEIDAFAKVHQQQLQQYFPKMQKTPRHQHHTTRFFYARSKISAKNFKHNSTKC